MVVKERLILIVLYIESYLVAILGGFDLSLVEVN